MFFFSQATVVKAADTAGLQNEEIVERGALIMTQNRPEERVLLGIGMVSWYTSKILFVFYNHSSLCSWTPDEYSFKSKTSGVAPGFSSGLKQQLWLTHAFRNGTV